MHIYNATDENKQDAEQFWHYTCTRRIEERKEKKDICMHSDIFNVFVFFFFCRKCNCCNHKIAGI